jgi:hypothetical protein
MTREKALTLIAMRNTGECIWVDESKQPAQIEFYWAYRGMKPCFVIIRRSE